MKKVSPLLATLRLNLISLIIAYGARGVDKMEEDTVTKLIHWRTFVTNQHQLANRLKITDADACQQLLVELLDDRFKNIADDDLADRITRHDDLTGWLITYERRTLERKHYRLLGKLSEYEYHSQSLERDEERGVLKLVINNQPTVLTEFKLQQLLPLFAMQNTKAFVESLIRYGEKETMVAMKLSKQQFKRKLRYIIEYVRNNRAKFDRIADDQRRQHLTKYNQLARLEQAINSGDEEVSEWLNNNSGLANEIVAVADCQYQGFIVKQYVTAMRHDQYAFANEVWCELMAEREWLKSSGNVINGLEVDTYDVDETL